MKNVIVTGTSRGLGLNVLELLISKGYTVYGITRQPIDYRHSNFYNIILDLSNSGIVEDELKKNIGNKIPIHGFVNNAAVAYDDIISNIDVNKLLHMYQVNVFSPLVITKFCIRNMIFNKIDGSIVHISSISAHTGYNGLSMYASTKGSLEAFSKNTAREWGKRGIRSNCVVAGFMETDMSSSLTDDHKKRIQERTCLKQLTSIHSVSNAIEFLISSKSNSITGQLIHVDSGTI